MMRGSMNSEWGSVLKAAPITINSIVNDSIKNFNVNGMTHITVVGSPPTTASITVNDKEVSVIVFAADAVTKEVLQVEKVKIR